MDLIIPSIGKLSNQTQFWNSTEKSNTTIMNVIPDCKTTVPSVWDFAQSMTIELMAMITIAGSFTFLTIFLFWRGFGDLKKQTPKEFLARTVVLCGLYQIVSLSSLISMFVPKAFVLCDMISHFTFLFGAYNLISLFIAYVGGESNFIKQCPDDAFILRTPPCCCCCLCCPPMIVTKGKFKFIRLLLAQFILIQGVVFVALNVIYIESSDLYNKVFLYFVPVFVTSILFGAWGLNIITRMMGPIADPSLKLRGKYLSLQLVLMFNKLQPIIGMVVVANVDFDCQYPLTTAVYKHEIVQLIITSQMFLLSLWARSLYRRPNKYEMITSTTQATMLEK